MLRFLFISIRVYFKKIQHCSGNDQIERIACYEDWFFYGDRLCNPDLNDMKEGVLEIKDDNLRFKEQYGNAIYFVIPLKDIGEVRTEGILLSSSMYNGMASMGAERNHLYVKFQKDGREHIATFANTSYNRTSAILERLKNKIKYLKFTLDNTTI